MRRHMHPILALFLPVFLTLASTLVAQEFTCGMREPAHAKEQAPAGAAGMLATGIAAHNGAYLPMRGHIRGLVVFAQTLNDDRQDEAWPLGQVPIWAEAYTSRLHEYFHDMSNGALDLRLDIFPHNMTTRNTEDGYIFWERRFGDAIKEIIDSVDHSIDFGQYDLWSSQGKMYEVTAEQDGQVDLIIVIFRRITNPYFMPYSGVSDLGFAGYKFVDGSLARFVYGGSGQANDAAASGVSICRAPGNGWIPDFDYVFRTSVHEIGHKLFGEAHPAELYGGLGVMAHAGNGDAMNSFERQLAGYTSFTGLTAGVDTTITLRDYVTTGEAFLLPVPQAFRSYYSLEFRAKKSKWDTAPVEGLYIYRIYDSIDKSSKTIGITSAEGRFDWRLDSATQTIFPIAPNALRGYTRFQRIPIGNKIYWAEGWAGDERAAFTEKRPELSVLKNPTPDFIFGSDTIRTGLRILLLGLTDSTATVRISYSLPPILSNDAAGIAARFHIGATYPLPATSGATVLLPYVARLDQEVSIEVFNSIGQSVARLGRTLSAGTGTLPLPSHTLAPGVYHVLIDAAGTRRRTSMVIAP